SAALSIASMEAFATLSEKRREAAAALLLALAAFGAHALCDAALASHARAFASAAAPQRALLGAVAALGAIALVSTILALHFARRVAAMARAPGETATPLSIDPPALVLDRAGLLDVMGRLLSHRVPDRKHAVIAVDLDRFGQVNELHGPAVGDMLV